MMCIVCNYHPTLFFCPPTLTLPHAGGGKYPFHKAVLPDKIASLPPEWGRVRVGGRHV